MKTPLHFAAAAFIALVFVPCAPILAVNIVTNGGFETGDFTGWTQSGNTMDTGVATFAAYSGKYGAYFGPSGSLGFISQDLVTIPGATYSLSFFLNDPFPGVPNNFIATFGGTTVYSLTDTNPGLGMYTFSVVATSALTTLQFGFRNDPEAWSFDDVSVEFVKGPSVPETGSTLAILGVGLVGIEGLRRKLAPAQRAVVVATAQRLRLL